MLSNLVNIVMNKRVLHIFDAGWVGGDYFGSDCGAIIIFFKGYIFQTIFLKIRRQYNVAIYFTCPGI